MDEIIYIDGVKRSTDIKVKTVEADGNSYEVPVIYFKSYEGMNWLTAGFSTRLGGVSEGIFESMNLSFSRGDDEFRVMKNHRIMARALDTKLSDCVYSYQTHTTNVMRVDRNHAGMGFTKERSFGEMDGLITNEPGIMLITAYADCVPLFFADTKNKAIGLSHSGWKGTVNNMAEATLSAMQEAFGTDMADVVAFIGPSICRNCYEVSEDVAEEFKKRYEDTELVNGTYEDYEHIVSLKSVLDNGEKKYFLNLHMANKVNMLRAGIKEENIHTTDICTCCNPKLLFSHRASKGQRGGLCAYMKIN